MPTVAAKALVTIIEDYFEAQIKDFAGASGLNPDPDLSLPQRLKTVAGGYLLDPQSYNAGPALGLAVYHLTPYLYNVGSGPDTSDFQSYYYMKLVAITAPSDSRKTSKDQAALLEYVIRQRLSALSLAPLHTEPTDYRKKEYVASMKWADGAIDISSSGQSSTKIVGFFTQEWVLTVESMAG